MHRPDAAAGRRVCAFLAAIAAVAAPASPEALEPRFDHRDQQGPSLDAIFVQDVVWSNSGGSRTAQHLAARGAWAFDPTGDGDELLVGAAWRTPVGSATTSEPIRLTVDVRYRAYLGTEELKTMFELGLWGSAADRFAVGPEVGVGVAYDFNRNIGLLASGFFAAGAGQVRVVSFGGGVGLQLRFE